MDVKINVKRSTPNKQRFEPRMLNALSKKPLTRFVVSCDGKDRQILKVLDKGDELTLMLIPATKMTDPPFEGKDILEQRYSVHATNHSPLRINEIKQTIRLEGGDLIETILDASGPKANQIQLIYGRACPDMSLDRYNVRSSPRDTVISLDRFYTKRRTMIYAVFIGSINGPTALAPSAKYLQISHDFKNFRLFVVWSYVGLPASPHGRLIHSLSNVPRINKEDLPGKLVPFVKGVSPKVARTGTIQTFEILSEIVRGYASEFLSDFQLSIIKEMGFGVWRDEEWDARFTEAARRVSAPRVMII